MPEPNAPPVITTNHPHGFAVGSGMFHGTHAMATGVAVGLASWRVARWAQTIPTPVADPTPSPTPGTDAAGALFPLVVKRLIELDHSEE